MTGRVTTVTSKGQLTIPVEIRRALDIKPGDRIAVEQRHDTVVLRRAQSVAERTAGAFAAYRKQSPLTPEQERQSFEEAVAQENR